MELLLTIIIGLSGAIYLGHHKEKKPSIALNILMVLLAFAPIFPDIGLYFMAREYQAISGVWPQPMLNDPKWMYNEGHGTYDALYEVVDLLYGVAIIWTVGFFVMLCTNWNRFSKRWRIMFGLVFSSAIVASCYDYGSLGAWWID